MLIIWQHKDLAERGGFEPPEPIRAQRFSRPPDSTALASLRLGTVCHNGVVPDRAYVTVTMEELCVNSKYLMKITLPMAVLIMYATSSLHL